MKPKSSQQRKPNFSKQKKIVFKYRTRSAAKIYNTDRSRWTLHGRDEMQFAESDEVDLHKYVKDCRKNPGHKKFRPVESFTLKQLPKYLRDIELFELIKATADLSVRVDVKTTSPHRPDFWPDTDIPYPSCNTGKTSMSRYGSGVIMNAIKWTGEGGKDLSGQVYDPKARNCTCSKCQKSGQHRKIWWELTVLTASHVVFDDFEADHTSCRLFYDTNQSAVVALDKVSLVKAEIEEDFCHLSYVTCENMELGNRISKMLQKWHDLWEKMNEKYSRSRFTFIVSHPHGCPKQVSFGQWVDSILMRTYDDGRVFTKLTYTTCTCAGSSGAGVYCMGFGEHVHSGSLDAKLNCSGVGFSSE